MSCAAATDCCIPYPAEPVRALSYDIERLAEEQHPESIPATANSAALPAVEGPM